MRYSIIGILLMAAVLVFAQEEERTPEGYRIIRIDTEQAKVVKDSVEQAKKTAEIEKEENREPVPFKFSIDAAASFGIRGIYGQFDTTYYVTDTSTGIVSGYDFQFGAMVLIPLTEYNFAIRTGVLLSHTTLYDDRPFLDPIRIKQQQANWTDTVDFSGDISQWRLTMPLLIAMKTMKSPVFFEFGPQFSIPLYDKYNDRYNKADLIDNGTRTSLDLAMLIGGEAIVTPRFSINVYFAFSLNEPYKKDEFFVGVSDMSIFEMRLGLTYSLF